MVNNLSHWEKEVFGSEKDYVIIGAGIVGLSTAYHIKAQVPTAKVVVVDRDFLSQGASTKNAGFACFGTVGEILSDTESMSHEEIVETVRMRYQGLKLLRSIVGDKDMKYAESGGYEVFTANEQSHYNQCRSKLEYVNNLIEDATGIKSCISVNEDLPINGFVGGFYNPYEGQLHPVYMINKLRSIVESLGVKVLNGLTLSDIGQEDHRAIFGDRLVMRYGKLIIATNAFAKDLFPQEDVVAYRNQVIMTEELSYLDWKGCFHNDKGYIYFRNYGRRILIGGARNIDISTESTSAFAENDMIISHLLHFLKDNVLGYIPAVDSSWSGIIATGGSKKPIIKQLDNDVYGGFRLGGMGVAVGSLVGKKLSELVTNDN